ncbi:extracellular solute-binding protein [Paenibacillus sp. N4]|nr:extracellular solute-binding protein [Paenibacillus vietnamensis]
MKKMKAKGFMRWLLAAAMLVTALSGCSNTNNEGATPTASANEPSDSAPGQTLEEVTLKIYFVGSEPPQTKEVWANVEQMSKSELNAKFDINFIPWADYQDKMKLLAASGDDFDLYFDANWFIFPTMLKNDALLPLDDLMDQYAPNLKKYLTDTNNLEWAKVNGKIMAIPTDNPSTHRAYATIREDLRKKYNIPEQMSTMEDLENYLDIVTKNEPGILALNNVTQGINNWDNAMNALATKYSLGREFGQSNFDLTFDLNDPKVTIVPLERTPAFLEASKIRRTWYEKGWIPKNAMNAPQETVNGIDDGKYAAVIRGTEDAFRTLNGPGEKKGYMMYPDSKSALAGSAGNLLGINKNAANPERAMMFLEWMNASQENYNAVMYGIKDKTYVIKQIDGVDTVAYPDGMDAQNGYLEWNGRWALWRSQWRLPSTFDTNKALADGTKADVEYENNVMPLVAGFNFDTEPVKQELTARQAVYDEYGRKLLFGLEADVDKAVDEYIKRMNEAGTDKIVAEMQKQMDAFLAAKGK